MNDKPMKLQLELTFEHAPRRMAKESSGRRLPRASWWFAQMHAVVDRARDWAPAPAPRPEQGRLTLAPQRFAVAGGA